MGDELATRLRGNGYRMTPQRQMVLDAVEALGHATPDDVRDHLGGAVNTSTVYRNLEVLQELGLVRHAHLSDRAPTYHSARAAEHFHLVCRECRNPVSVDPARASAFADLLRSEFGFVADMGHLTVFGECVDCEATSTQAAGSRTGESPAPHSSGGDRHHDAGHGHGHGH